MRVGRPGEKIWESSTNLYFLLETQSPSNVMVVSFTRPSEGGIRAFSVGPGGWPFVGAGGGREISSGCHAHRGIWLVLR